MNDREKRIGRVLAVKVKQRLQAQAALELAQQDMMKATQTEKQRRISADRLGRELVALDARCARDMQLAAEMFQRARAEQQEARRLLEEAEGLVGERRAAFFSIEREIKSLELVAGKLRRAREAEQNRREQSFLDEVAARSSIDRTPKGRHR